MLSLALALFARLVALKSALSLCSPSLGRMHLVLLLLCLLTALNRNTRRRRV